MKKRIEWIDVMKYISMMFIMYSHTDFSTTTMSTIYNPFYLFAFFFASGFVYVNKDDFKTFILKKVRGLLIPWLLFGFLQIFTARIISFNSHGSIKQELIRFFVQIRALDDKMWFLSAIFMAFIPFFFVIRKYEELGSDENAKIRLFVMCFILSLISNIYTSYMNPELLPWGNAALPWHIEYIFFAMFWMLIGYLFKIKYEEVYDKKVLPKYFPAFIILYLLFVFMTMPFIQNITQHNRFVNILLGYVATFLALVMLICLCKAVKPNKYVLYIGQNTIICFGIHGKGYSALQTLMKKINYQLYQQITSNEVMSIIVGIIFTFILSVLLIIPIYIINRWFPILAGKRNNRNR